MILVSMLTFNLPRCARVGGLTFVGLGLEVKA